MKQFFVFFISLCSLFVVQNNSYANTKIPTNIVSQHMQYSEDMQSVVFSGKVHVKRQDFQMWADTITVYLERSSTVTSSEENIGMSPGEISSIVAFGNVIMTSDNKEAKAEKATYDIKKDTLTLEGKPKPTLRDRDNTIQGTTIVHHMKKNLSEIQGGVEATFMSPEQTPPRAED